MRRTIEPGERANPGNDMEPAQDSIFSLQGRAMAQSRASRRRGLALASLLSGLLEAAWLALLVVTALHLNPYSRTGFEPDKAAIARTLILLGAGTWLALRLLGERSARSSHGRAGTLAVFVLVGWIGSEVLSATGSVAPILSWAGSYARRQGAWLEIGYVGLFAVVAVQVRDWAQWRRMRFAITATSVPICLLAIMQRFDVVALGSIGGIGGTLGNSTFLAGYLLFPLFITADFVAEQVALGRTLGAERGPRPGGVLASLSLPVSIIALQTVTLLLTRGSAALVGLVAASGLLTLLVVFGRRASLRPGSALRGGRWRPAVALVLIAFLLLSAVALVSLATSGSGHRAATEQLVQIATLVNPDVATNRVRLLVWGAASEAIRAATATGLEGAGGAWRLFAGYGQETTWLAIERHYPAQLERYEGWNVVPDRAHNRVLEVLLGRGLLGLVGYLVVAFGLLLVGLRTAGVVPGADSLRPLRTRALALLLTGALLAHLVETQFGIAVTATQSYFWLLGGLLVALGHGRLSHAADTPPTRASDGGIEGLVVALMLATLAFGVMAPGTMSPALAVALMAGCWLSGLGLWLGRAVGHRVWSQSGWRWVLRFVAASLAIVLVYVGFHALQLGTVFAQRAAGDEVAAATNLATFFDGYQACVLVIVVVLGVLLARRGRAGGEPTRIDSRPPVAVPAWRRPRVAGGVVILLALGWVLPRLTALQAVRADILAAQAEGAQRRAHYASASTIYRQALALRPDEVVYRVALASVYADWAAGTRRPEARDRRFRRGVRELRHAIRSPVADSTTHANLARLYALWGELDSRSEPSAQRWRLADGEYRAALRRRPRSARYYAEWGRLAILQGDTSLAAERFVRSLSRDSTSGQTYIWLQPLLSRDLLDGAEVLGELSPEMTAIAPAQVYAALVEHYAEAGSLKEAIRAAHRLDRSRPDDPTGARALAVLYQRAGDLAAALTHARRAYVLSTGRQRRQVARLLEALEVDAASRSARGSARGSAYSPADGTGA